MSKRPLGGFFQIKKMTPKGDKLETVLEEQDEEILESINQLFSSYTDNDIPLMNQLKFTRRNDENFNDLEDRMLTSYTTPMKLTSSQYNSSSSKKRSPFQDITHKFDESSSKKGSNSQEIQYLPHTRKRQQSQPFKVSLRNFSINFFSSIPLFLRLDSLLNLFDFSYCGMKTSQILFHSHQIMLCHLKLIFHLVPSLCAFCCYSMYMVCLGCQQLNSEPISKTIRLHLVSIDFSQVILQEKFSHVIKINMQTKQNLLLLVFFSVALCQQCDPTNQFLWNGICVSNACYDWLVTQIYTFSQFGEANNDSPTLTSYDTQLTVDGGWAISIKVPDDSQGGQYISQNNSCVGFQVCIYKDANVEETTALCSGQDGSALKINVDYVNHTTQIYAPFDQQFAKTYCSVGGTSDSITQNCYWALKITLSGYPVAKYSFSSSIIYSKNLIATTSFAAIQSDQDVSQLISVGFDGVIPPPEAIQSSLKIYYRDDVWDKQLSNVFQFYAGDYLMANLSFTVQDKLINPTIIFVQTQTKNFSLTTQIGVQNVVYRLLLTTDLSAQTARFVVSTSNQDAIFEQITLPKIKKTVKSTVQISSSEDFSTDISTVQHGQSIYVKHQIQDPQYSTSQITNPSVLYLNVAPDSPAFSYTSYDGYNIYVIQASYLASQAQLRITGDIDGNYGILNTILLPEIQQ